jgi:hypothetical protein
MSRVDENTALAVRDQNTTPQCLLLQSYVPAANEHSIPKDTEVNTSSSYTTDDLNTKKFEASPRTKLCNSRRTQRM